MDDIRIAYRPRTAKDPAPRLPDHELIRLDAAAHPERTHSEHVEAARKIYEGASVAGPSTRIG